MSRVAIAATLLLVLSCTREAARPAPAASPTAAGEPISGIGIRPMIDAHGFAVGQLFPGSPAERAGLRVGDVVTAVDGEASARWTLARVAARLRGRAGSRVTLRIERGGAVFERTIVRDELRQIPELPL